MYHLIGHITAHEARDGPATGPRQATKPAIQTTPILANNYPNKTTLTFFCSSSCKVVL